MRQGWERAGAVRRRRGPNLQWSESGTYHRRLNKLEGAMTSDKASGGTDDGVLGDDLATALLGETEVDEMALDQAVADLNRIYTTQGMETIRIVGEYVLERFFGGDPAVFRDRSKKHLTFRQLAGRDDLQMSYSFVWKSVAVVHQLRVLPQDVAQALSMSHHIALLPVKDAGEKVRLAQAAADEGLGREALLARVKEARLAGGPASKAGRPALPAFVKAFRRLGKLRALAGSEAVNAGLLEAARMAPEEALVELGKARVELEAALALVGTLESAVRGPAG